jgi:hypothetical protein
MKWTFCKIKKVLRDQFSWHFYFKNFQLTDRLNTYLFYSAKDKPEIVFELIFLDLKSQIYLRIL